MNKNQQTIFQLLNAALTAVAKVAAEYNCYDKILLCGSRAKLSHTANADVDLLVPSSLILLLQQELKARGFEPGLKQLLLGYQWGTTLDFTRWSWRGMIVDLIVPVKPITNFIYDPEVQGATPLDICAVTPRVAWQHTLLHDTRSFTKWRRAVKELELEKYLLTGHQLSQVTSRRYLRQRGLLQVQVTAKKGWLALGHVKVPPGVTEIEWLEGIQEVLREIRIIS